MNEILITLLAVTYSLAGAVGTFAYWPTIKDLYQGKKNSANESSYTLWTITTDISFLYGVLVFSDLTFGLISGLSFLSCIIILMLNFNIKHKSYPKEVNLCK